MEPGRPRTTRRKPRRGTLQRPLEGRLVRSLLLVAVIPFALLVFTLGRTTALPPPTLAPAFDGAAATALAKELSELYPDRVPGGPGSLGAAQWYAEKLELYGIPTELDRWTEDVPGLGEVELRNVAAVVEGAVPEAIVVVANRDSTPLSAGANRNATGTAALIELARPYATPTTGGTPTVPQHTLVFVSTDAGAWGSFGAERFASASRFAGRILAVVVLDALSGTDVRLVVDGDATASPATALIGTAQARLREQMGRAPSLPSLGRQLVNLSLPFGYGDQAPFLGHGASALRVTTRSDSDAGAVADRPDTLRELAFERVGLGAQALVGSLDGGVAVAAATPAVVLVGDRVVRGWALGLLFAALVIPFLGGVADLLARCRRRQVALGPAWRALITRLALWAWFGAIVLIGAALSIFPSRTGRPLPPSEASFADWSQVGLVGGGILAAAGWLVTRRRLTPSGPRSSGADLAAYAVALSTLAVLAVVVAIVNAIALLLLLPSLYAWLFLTQASRRPVCIGLFLLGLVGPLGVLVSIAGQFEFGITAVPYALGLVSTAYLSWPTVLGALLWCGIAAQVAAVASGRYAPVTRTSWLTRRGETQPRRT